VVGQEDPRPMSRHEFPDPHQTLPDPTHSERGTTRVRRFVFAIFVAALATFSSPGRALELRLSTENDLLGSRRTHDDLYTFAIGFEVDRGPYTVSLRENAFTDRAANLRFDESSLTVGRSIAAPLGWSARAEAGAVRIGNGIFGQATQNTVHDLIGNDEVELSYQGQSLHPHAALTAERWRPLGDALDVSPRLELDTTPGLRSHAVVAGAARWQLRQSLALNVLVGGRFTHAAHPALRRHLVPRAAVARVGVEVRDRILLSWTYNEYGDKREHLSVGYRLSTESLGRLHRSGAGDRRRVVAEQH